MSADVMNPEVEFSSHGASGAWKIPGVTEEVYSFIPGVSRPQQGSETSLYSRASCSLLLPLTGF